MLFGKYGIFSSGNQKKKKQDLHSSFTTESFKEMGNLNDQREHSFMNFNTNPDQSFQDDVIPTMNSDEEGSPSENEIHTSPGSLNQNFTAIMNTPSRRVSRRYKMKI
jgi:hypothetical protein